MASSEFSLPLASPAQVRRAPTLLESLGIQKRVIKAMIIREMKTRFGARRLGYFWVILEPLIHISIFIMMFGMGMRKDVPGVPFPLMLLTGLIPFFAFRTILSACMEAANSNQGLFSYSRVKPYDAILSRAILEGTLAICSFVVLLFLFTVYLGNDFNPSNIPECFAAAALMWLLGLGMGTIACVAVRLFPELRKFIPALLRPLYFVSGIFFLATDLNSEILTYLSWNPIFIIIEHFRDGFFDTYTSPVRDWSYVVYWVVGANGIGLILYRRYRFNLIGKQQ